MTDMEQATEESQKKGGGKKRFVLLAAIAAAIAGVLVFLRIRKGSDEDDEFADDEI